MKTRIEIDTKTFVRFWLVVIGFALAFLVIYSAMSALIIIGSAFFLSLVLNPLVKKVEKTIPQVGRIGATVIAYIIFIVIGLIFVFLVAPPMIEQTAKFIETIPTVFSNLASKWQGLDSFVVDHNLQAQLDNAVKGFQSSAAGWAANAGSSVISGIGSIFSFIGALFLTLVLSFLMLIEGNGWLKRLWGVYDNQKRMVNHRRLAQKMYNVVTGYVIGQLTVSGIGAIASAAMVLLLALIFHMPLNLVVPSAAIAFVLSLVPMFGTTIGGIIISLLLFSNDTTAGVIFAVYFIIYQQIENNLIGPKIQSKTVELSPLAVLVAITIGLYVFGLAGGIISIPIAGCIKVLTEDYFERSKHNRIKSEKPLERLVNKLKGKDDDIVEVKEKA